jgi:hypothetical protein
MTRGYIFILPRVATMNFSIADDIHTLTGDLARIVYPKDMQFARQFGKF